MRYLFIVFGLFLSFFGNAQSQGVTNSQTKLRPNQLRWSPTGATNDSIYIIKGNETTGEPAWYLVKLGGGSGVQDTTLAGDVVGGLNSTFVRKINGVTVENKTPQNREVLTYNGTQWTPDSIDLSDLPQMNASRLLGRGSATSGAPEQITAGQGLRISTNVLEAHLSAGTGITLSGGNPLQINNSLPDQTVTISGGGINTVSGTYPNFTVTGTEVDGSTTNEIQTIDTLAVAGGLLRLKLSGSAVKTLATSNFSTSPAGSSMQVQYNNAGSFGALDSFTVSANPDRVGIGVPVPTARLDIQGSGATSATNALRVRNSAGTSLLTVRNDGYTSFAKEQWQLFATNWGIASFSDNLYLRPATGKTTFLQSGDQIEKITINNSGVTIGGSTTATAGLHLITNTTASTPSMLLSGTGFSGGTTTTTKPTFLIEPTGTTSTGWATSGTKLGVNAESGFTGLLMDLELNGVPQFSVSSGGSLNIKGGISAPTGAITSGSDIVSGGYFGVTSRSWLRSVTNGNWTMYNNATTDFGLLQFGGTTSSFPALKRNGTGLDVRLADDSGFAPQQDLYRRFGSGSPESVVTAPVGAVYHRTDGGAGTSFYVKESGAGNTGWVAK